MAHLAKGTLFVSTQLNIRGFKQSMKNLGVVFILRLLVCF